MSARIYLRGLPGQDGLEPGALSLRLMELKGYAAFLGLFKHFGTGDEVNLKSTVAVAALHGSVILQRELITHCEREQEPGIRA